MAVNGKSIATSTLIDLCQVVFAVQSAFSDQTVEGCSAVKIQKHYESERSGNDTREPGSFYPR